MDNGFTLKLDARTLSVGFTGDVTDFAPDAVGSDASVFAKNAASQYFTAIHRVSRSMRNLAAGGRPDVA
jgi:hypothetical protein